MLVTWRRRTEAVAAVAMLTATLLGAGQAAAAPRVPAHTRVTAGRVVTRPGVPPAVSQDPQIAAEIGHDNTVGYDGNSFNIDGRRIFLWSGEFHYFRLPSPSLWRDVLQKMKSGGFDAVSIYFDWAYHSPRPGVYDFSGVRNLDELLDIAEQVGVYVVARPGPYINGEVDGGGLPGWSTTLPGNSRSADAAYLNAALAWQHQVDRILARHQVTNGAGTVLLDQIENEYCFASSTQNLNPSYMEALENQARADGITVPLFTNVCYPAGATWASGPGKVDVSAWDAYPNGLSCSNPAAWSDFPDYSNARAMTPGTEPLYMAEFQDGSFDPWGGAGYDNCRTMDNGAFERIIAEDAIAGGFSGMNFYMEYGGTTWGWQTDTLTSGYSSYDYGAAITESRQLTSKYYDMKSLAYLTQSVSPLTDTEPEAAPPSSNANVAIGARVNPGTGTQFFTIRQADSRSTATESTTFTLNDADGTFQVPSAPGTAITLAGRDSKLLIAGYDMGGQHLVYSTSELMTHTSTGAGDVAVFYGRTGQAGETVLRYSSQPTVRVLAGTVAATWDASTGDLRLDYTHGSLARVQISGGGRGGLLLLIGDDAAVSTIWRMVTTGGPLLVDGPELTRTATYQGSTLALTGDTTGSATLEVFAPPSVRNITWNGRPVTTVRTASGSLAGPLPGPQPVSLPSLSTWKTRVGSPETAPGFDDSSWTVADHMTTNNPTAPVTLPVLYADDYGFHQGDIWYRGHFTATGTETAINLTGDTGNDGVYAVWLNGTYLGSSGNGPATFAFPAGVVKPGGDNVIAVLLENMGHTEESVRPDNAEKQPRGLAGASVAGSAAAVSWRIQGDRGGEDPVDPVRGLANTGGLYGERSGWYLPGYPDGSWHSVTLPSRSATAGVVWYRTQARLSLPADQDVSVGLTIGDTPARDYRALIYVNGWQIGRYINNLGPEHTFPIPDGILRTDGDNTIALAVLNLDPANGGIGSVGFTLLGNARSSLQAVGVDGPGWNAGTYGSPAGLAAEPQATLQTAPVIAAGTSAQVTGVTTNVGERVLNRATATLTVPAGWTATALGGANIGPLAPGASASTRWTVMAPVGASPGSLSLVETISYASAGRAEFTTAAATARVPYGSLAAAFDNTGVTADSAPSSGDFDGAGSTFSATALANIGVSPGATVTAGGRTFTWPGSNPGTPDNVLADGQAITLEGQGGSLAFLGASADGDTSGTVVVYYTDGTSQQVPLSLSDFYFLPPRVASNQVAFTTSYFNSSSGGCYEGTASGDQCYHPISLFVETAAINPGKTVAAVVFPAIADSVGTPQSRVSSMHIFAMSIGTP